MDDETAEIELLEQNLNKTRLISQRMTAILDSFDTRLAKLEKSILPLYTSTQRLNRRANNIEKVLLKIDDLASNQEGIAAEEALILRGPQPGQLDAYREALERLNATIAFGTADKDSANTARLIETGAKKVTQLYTKVVAEGSSGSTPNPGVELTSAPFPPSLQLTLSPLVAFLRTLPLPATHPSHPAAAAISTTLKDAQKGYADMRGTWARKCLEGQGKRVLDRVDTVDNVVAGKEFGRWVGSLLSVAEGEYGLLLDMAPLSSPPLIASSYSTLIQPILTLFSTTLTSLIAVIKRALHKYTFLALSAYETLLTHQPQWEKLLARRAHETRKESNELRDGLHSLRAVCLRSFPEFLADIKLSAMGKGGDAGTGVAEITVSTVRYMERLPEVQSAVGSALLTLGDGNWKMGDGVQVRQGSKLGEGDELVILEHFIYDVITTLISSLNMQSRGPGRRPAIGSIFLLNNISYLRQRLIAAPENPDLKGLFSKPTEDTLNSNFRTAKAAYFDSNFSYLLQSLIDDPKEKAGKAATKEKFTRFYDLLEEVIDRHRMVRVLEDDPGGRETISEEVNKLVVPSLKRFIQRTREKEFSKNPQKYIKLSAEEVDSLLRNIYNYR